MKRKFRSKGGKKQNGSNKDNEIRHQPKTS